MLQFVYELSAEIFGRKNLYHSIPFVVNKYNTHSVISLLFLWGKVYQDPCSSHCFHREAGILSHLQVCTNHLSQFGIPESIPHAGAAFHPLDHCIPRKVRLRPGPCPEHFVVCTPYAKLSDFGCLLTYHRFHREVSVRVSCVRHVSKS